MKIAELRKLPTNEIQKRLLEKQERLRALRFQLATKQVKNIREVRELKREIARIFTVQKELAKKKSKATTTNKS